MRHVESGAQRKPHRGYMHVLICLVLSHLSSAGLINTGLKPMALGAWWHQTPGGCISCRLFSACKQPLLSDPHVHVVQGLMSAAQMGWRSGSHASVLALLQGAGGMRR
jgi:hypothetical protein